MDEEMRFVEKHMLTNVAIYGVQVGIRRKEEYSCKLINSKDGRILPLYYVYPKAITAAQLQRLGSDRTSSLAQVRRQRIITGVQHDPAPMSPATRTALRRRRRDFFLFSRSAPRALT